MDVLLCWGSCSEISRSREHFQLILIKQRLAARLLRSVSSEIFEPCLWLAAPKSNHLRAAPLSALCSGCSHTTQPGKHSQDTEHHCQHQALYPTPCAPIQLCPMHISTTLCFHALDIIIAAESCSSEAFCTQQRAAVLQCK